MDSPVCMHSVCLHPLGLMACERQIWHLRMHANQRTVVQQTAICEIVCWVQVAYHLTSLHHP